MEGVATRLLWPLLGLTLLLFIQLPGTRATGRRLSHPDPLPPCSQKPGGVSGWDCYDPPNHPLLPCDFHHQRIGVDCSGWRPVTVSHADADAASPTTFESKTRPLLERHIAIDLPPCSRSQSSGGRLSTDSWKCYDAPTRHLPPALGSDVGEASQTATVVESETTSTQENLGGHVEAELPPCSQVPGGIPGWNCYDPTQHPLPPCDFQHQRIGFDCSGWPPASRAGAGAASPTTYTFKSKTRPLLGRRHTAIDLPPCSLSSRDSTDSWKCGYDDASQRHLPPCDIINRIIGVNCSGWPPKWPPAVGSANVGEASDPATVVESEETTTQEKPGGP